MKLGGHETFYPRPGWLTKGMLHLWNNCSGAFSRVDVADALGVGRNMARSIGWWLRVTGLAERPGHNKPLVLSSFGKTVARFDPYMTSLGTWWFVHANAMTVGTKSSLPWFFSHRRPSRFDRATLVESMHQSTRTKSGKPLTIKRVQREVSTVLQAYAVPVPRSVGDPEDNLGCSLHRLNLLRHLCTADRYERSEPTPMPPETLGLVLSSIAAKKPSHLLDEDVEIDILISDAAISQVASMLGRNREQLLEVASSGAQQLGAARMDVRSLAGRSTIAVRSARSATWAGLFYNRAGYVAKSSSS